MKIGIVGAGQLGRMLAQAGTRLNHSFRFLWNEESESCRGLGEFSISDLKAPDIDAFCDGIDCATYEFENLPVSTISDIAKKTTLYPPPIALEVGQDRINEKTFFNQLGIKTAKFRSVDSEQDAVNAADSLGLPFVLKTRQLGYDGKGQAIVKTKDDISAAVKALGTKGLIAEEFLKFDRELSVIGVRSKNGETAIYPLFQNHHENGILIKTIFPAPNSSTQLVEQAESAILKIITKLEYVGVIALELFEVKGQLIANEMAPRVHNSGHVTIDAAVTSQFENHIRAITGMPLGSTAVKTPGIMFNFIGGIPDQAELAKFPSLKLHLYGKSLRSGRKVGHATLIDANPSNVSAIEKLSQAARK